MGIDQGFVFQSVKCVRPIWCTTAVLEHHLIQMTLDGTTDTIDQIAVKAGGGTFVRYVVAWRCGAGVVQQIGLPSTAGEVFAIRRAAASQGLAIETLDPREVLAEPRCSAARAVWALRDRDVDPAMRIAVLSALAEGQMSLDELCAQVPGPADPIPAIASLACAGDIRLDLSASFGPDTPVKIAA